MIEFCARVDACIGQFTEFVQRVVVHRRDFAVREWRSWVLKDPLVHPYRWLRPDFVPPAPLIKCNPKDTVDGCGVLVEPAAIDGQFTKAWMPFFCSGARGGADLDSFRAVADEVQLLPLSGDMLHEAVQKKKPAAGSLDGWGWREFKALAGCLVFIGWPLYSPWWRKMGFVLIVFLDAYIAMIPKVDGDSIPLGQRPLCVLPVVYWLWASVRLQQLQGWFRSWAPQSVVLGKVAVLLKLATLLPLPEKSFSGALDSGLHIFFC